MPKYKVTNKATGKSYMMTGEQPPSEDQVKRLFDSFSLKQDLPIKEEPQNFVEKNIVPQIEGSISRVKERASRTFDPTVLGGLAQKATGTTGKLGEFVEGAFGAPERWGRATTGAFGTIGEPIGALAETAIKGVNKALGGVPGELVQKAISAGVNTDIGQKVVGGANKWWEGLSAADKANYGSLTDVFDMIGLKTKNISKLPIKPENVSKAIEKGVKSSIPPVKNAKQFRKFFKDGDRAVRAIAEYKDELNIVGDFGEKITKPRNSKEMAEAIEQVKQKVYNKYHDLAVQAGDAEGFDVAPIMQEIEGVSSSLKKSKGIRDYALKKGLEIEELAGASPEIIEERIKELNSSLLPFYTSGANKIKAQVDASIAKLMRDQLDKKISEAVGDGYSELKKQYGSLRAIEDRINLRAAATARNSGKGIFDLTDIFTGSQITAGVLTANPALLAKGVSGKAIKEIYKRAVDPELKIKKMFDAAYKATEPGITKQIPAIPIGSIGKGLTRPAIENLNLFNNNQNTNFSPPSTTGTPQKKDITRDTLTSLKFF